jgi:hypothetical protein
MTGVLNAMVGQGGSVYSVTVGTNGLFYGFNSADAFGAISPSTTDLGITIEGSHTQNYFSGVTVQTTSGSIRYFPSSSATFSTFGSSPVLSGWTWDTNTPAWTATTPSPRFMIIK